MAPEKYRVEIRDACGVLIGDGNVVYQYFLPENYRLAKIGPILIKESGL